MQLDKFQLDNFSVKVYDSLLDKKLAQIWQANIHELDHLRTEMLVLLEKAQPADLHFRYLFIAKSGEEKHNYALVYFQLLNFNHRNFNFSKKGLFQYFAQFFLRIKSFRVLLAGSLFAVDFTPISSDHLKITTDQLLSVINEYSKREKYDILVLKDLPERYTKTFMKDHDFDPFETDMTMQLEINPAWKDFNSYEKALTHKYAQRVRKIRKQGSSLVRREISLVEFHSYRTQINKLFRQVSEKQTVRMGIVDDVYFEELYKTLEKNFKLTGYFISDKLIAFASHIIYKDKLEVHYIGLDYELNKEYSLYFNILYDGIELAIQYEKKSLELGRTAREAKAVVGCHPIFFNDYLRVRNRLIRWMLNFLSNYFDKGLGEGWKKRHPFKTIATGIK